MASPIFKSQIFKTPIPNHMLFDLLDKICIKYDKYYLFNFCSYQKGIYNNSIPDFLQECTHYYHTAKQKYLNKKQTCNSFITVLRQICNNNNITYKYQIKYDKNNYDILYFIYFD